MNHKREKIGQSLKGHNLFAYIISIFKLINKIRASFLIQCFGKLYQIWSILISSILNQTRIESENTSEWIFQLKFRYFGHPIRLWF
jgi:hypothetical protein